MSKKDPFFNGICLSMFLAWLAIYAMAGIGYGIYKLIIYISQHLEIIWK